MSELASSAIANTAPVEDLRPVDVVSTSDAGLPCLRGSFCADCRQIAFPPRDQCAQCYRGPLEEVPLSREGSLYAFSTVHVSSSEEVPYTLGFVDLPGDIRILSKLFGSADDFGIDDPVVFAVHDDGGWGFEAAGRAVSRG